MPLHHFKFEGKTYTIYKRAHGRDDPWYTKFAIRGERFHRSLDTNNKDAAQQRAIEWVIRPARAGAQPAGPRCRRKLAPTLAETFAIYDRVALIGRATKNNNKGALLLLFKWAGEDTTAERARLSAVVPGLVRRAQAGMVNAYLADGEDERQARELALRSSKSLFNQAKSIFSARKDLPAQYADAGLDLPECVQEFCQTRVQGKMSKDRYFPPADEVVRKTFLEIEGLKESSAELYRLFWLVIGTGMRRGEAAEARTSHFQEINGRLWVAAGTGKDGRPIQLPLIHNTLLKDYTSTSPMELVRSWCAGAGDATLLPGDSRMRNDTLPAKLNFWLECQGWKDQKKMHNLRAFVGSKIYEFDPRLAQVYLRHKTLAMTEQFYSQFSKLHAALDRL